MNDVPKEAVAVDNTQGDTAAVAGENYVNADGSIPPPPPGGIPPPPPIGGGGKVKVAKALPGGIPPPPPMGAAKLVENFEREKREIEAAGGTYVLKRRNLIIL